jgi:alkyl hydroperoxide reductase subunit AhpC
VSTSPWQARLPSPHFPTFSLRFSPRRDYGPQHAVGGATHVAGNDESSIRGGTSMPVRLGDDAPNFTAETTEGTINLYDYLGDGWGMLFSHPKDFTPVCTTELGAFAKRKGDFDQRGVKLIGVSVDPLDSHRGWASDIEETQGAALNYPLIADPERKVADLYDMIHPNANDTLTVRSVFIIGPDKKVKLIITYPASTGRNVDELLRVIDSLQLTANYQVATPVNWSQGEDVIIVPAVSDEDAKGKFPKGWKTLKPYLRVTPQPDK